MLKRWIMQYYLAGIYTDQDLETFVASKDLTEDEAAEIKNSKQAA